MGAHNAGMRPFQPTGSGTTGRLYLASNQISHAVVRSRSRQELLNEVARVMVESGEFAMCFVSCYDLRLTNSGLWRITETLPDMWTAFGCSEASGRKDN